jgi:hypothetical protein
MITYERLREVLDYNADTGVFVWKESRGKIIAGDRAGCKGKNGYAYICVDYTNYLAHRLAWLYVHGYYPENSIDHMNHTPLDNRLCNLREVSHRCNMRNAKQQNNNNSGVTGVCWDDKRNRWRAYINANRHYHIGYYKNFDEAVCHRLAVEQCLNWGDCDTQSSAEKYVRNNIQK